MKVRRGDVLARLSEAAVGLSQKETLEQSDCFVFSKGTLTTFNEEIMVRCASPFPFDAVVRAADLLGIIEKIPDDEIDVSVAEGELKVRASKRRTAGLTSAAEVALPLDSVPMPEKWSKLGELAAARMQQAAQTCSDDETQYISTCVHIRPDLVEACDNVRLFRAVTPTGFPARVLVPASSIAALASIELSRVSLGEGWCHFRTPSKTVISVRCTAEPYHDEIDQILKQTNAVKLVLPSTLAEMISRAEVFNTAKFDSLVGIRLGENELTITSRKDGGWYRERKRIRYTDRPLDFEVNPTFLVELLGHTREVRVDDTKMKIVADGVEFVVSLRARVERTERVAKKAKAKKETADVE